MRIYSSVVHSLATLVLTLVCAVSFVNAAPPGIEFNTIDKGTSSGFFDAADVVVTDADEWERVWTKLHSRRQVPPLPDVDFNQRMIVVTALGAAPTHGFGIEITAVIGRREWIEVRIREVFPGKGCILPASQTEPYHVIEIPRGTRLVFRRDRTVIHC